MRNHENNEEHVRSRNIARASFEAYPPHIAHYWLSPRHNIYLCQKLQEVNDGKIKRLMVFMPPRHGKSETVSVYYPSWYLGNNPDKNFALISYGDALAKSFSRRTRDLVESYGEEVFGISVSRDSRAVNSWHIHKKRGGLICAGIGGPLTGKGAHILDIDDPVKNAQEANNKTKRDAVWDWWCSTAYTRLEPGGAVIVCLTRWHEDDLAGRLLRQAKEDPTMLQWEVISFPAIAEENDILGRQPGEALWPERYPIETLMQIKKMVGSYWWNALYMQRPQPEEGYKFKRGWFHYFSEEMIGPDLFYCLHRGGNTLRYEASKCRRFQTSDTAATEKEYSDYFVISTWAVTPDNDLLLLDVFREKAETTKHMDYIRSQFFKWQPDFVGVENKTFGINIIQESIIQGIPVRELKADRDKLSRSIIIATKYENGKVFHKSGAHYVSEWENELVMFPTGSHDDQVDTASYAGISLVEEMGEAYAEVGGPMYPELKGIVYG